MSDSLSSLRRKREQMFDDAGGGIWFRNTDAKQIEVDVSFYPTTKLYIVDGESRTPINSSELKAKYHRLAV